jgi:hypothetical protein
LTDLVSFATDSEGTTDFGSTSSVNDAVVANQVSDYAKGIVHTALGLLDNLEKVEYIQVLVKSLK